MRRTIGVARCERRSEEVAVGAAGRGRRWATGMVRVRIKARSIEGGCAVLAKVSFWWIVVIHASIGAIGVVLGLSGLVFGSGDGSLDITAVLSGGIALFALAGLVACTPALVMLRRELTGAAPRGSIGTVVALALPIVLLVLPILGDHRYWVAVGAMAAVVPLVLTVVSAIRRTATRG